MITRRMMPSVVTGLVFVLLMAGTGAVSEVSEGSGSDLDYDYSSSVESVGKPVLNISSDDEVLDPIEDGSYPEDDDDYGAALDNPLAMPSVEDVLEVIDSASVTTDGPGEEHIPDSASVRIGLLETFELDAQGSENATETVSTTGLTESAGRAVVDVTPAPDCRGFTKLSTQPQFTNGTFNVIRKCCPPGESFLFNDNNQAVHCKPSSQNSIQVQAIIAQFFQGCIEDLEEEAPPLGVVYGNPCAVEDGLIRFSANANDSLYVLQNGSLLVVNELVEEYDIFTTYCLDVDRTDGLLNGYVCSSEFRIGRDIFKGQMMALALCLAFAIPLLLATAFFYVAIPEFDDIHGKALSLNCVNFAIAVLLECIFQHKSQGNGSTDDTIVLANYTDYFILATFFWLMVNCMNNCIHAWYFLPNGIQIEKRGEKRTFALYTAFAQLVPLAIILLNPPNSDPTALKHYFFLPIIVVIVLNIISFFITFWGFQRVSDIQIQHFSLRGRMSNGGEEANAFLARLPNIITADVERVKYMAKYTALLFMVMSGVWTITIATYYSTRTIPILYDILFGLQGILIFIIFICLPRPFRTVKAWFEKNKLCGCRQDPDAIDLRRDLASYQVSSNGNTKEGVPLNNIRTSE
ncbi:probable G-protein coupled receptor Mth-like 14 [Ochlerotatus camptorhynchus]|uniref:probable G-protein coupled receptor Mth-like 14 n=1 Tax=Ochlerotatus camptorhynchus TaxID=644619 RepID=UPI0031E117D6